VNAINSVKDKEKLKESILYVNLEPCSHFGKTPPCSDLIIKMGIPEVVIGNIDPFEKVAGKGIQKLKKAKIKVVSGIMETECKELNKRFITFHVKKRPYIILKWAQTTDGFISPKKKTIGKPAWITDEKLRMLVHKIRTEEQAIMVGTNTALLDDPQLNARYWKGKDPVRIVLDQNLRLPNTLHLFDKSIPTIVFTSKKTERSKSVNLEYIRIDFSKNMVKQICDTLSKKNIQSLFIEGGTILLQTFIDSKTWDEALIFTGNQEFRNGVKAPKIKGKVIDEIHFDKDKLTILKNE
jgi:diaminohydroxyphosphoribosylaminopyrimidine deaminase/5-amino-6-(5-phosphoribosylamino)uracil reductase